MEPYLRAPYSVEEDHREIDMNQQALQWLWRMPGNKKGIMLLLVLLEMLHGFSGVLYALLLRTIVDAAVSQNRPEFWRGILLTGILVLAQLVLRAGIRYLNESERSLLENLYKRRLTENILMRDYASVSAVHSGEWLNRLTGDTMIVANGCVEILPGIAGRLVKLISALAMIVVLQPILAAAIIPAGMLLLLITFAIRKRLKILNKEVREADGRLRVFLQERLGSLMVLRSFSAEKRTIQGAVEKMDAHKAVRMRKVCFTNFCNVGYGFAIEGMVLLGICWCGYGILVGTVSFGTLTAITQLITQIQTPISSLTGYLPRYYAVIASAERLMEIEEIPREPEERLNLDEVLQYYKNDFQAVGMEHASFTYLSAGDETKQVPVVLSDVSFTIQKGEFVALTGPSGSGKTTILKILLCMFPLDSGKRFLLDCGGGKQELTAAWRRLFAYVPQGNWLMNGTIRDVVCFAEKREEHDEDRFWNALRVAGAEEFVLEQEQGADTVLGERGGTLSEGQMQRLAIARALYAGSPVLLLDEATSALDEVTELKLLENLHSQTDKTIVIVTHRRAALAFCDKCIEIAARTEEDQL